jgi:hypothetical protein
VLVIGLRRHWFAPLTSGRLFRACHWDIKKRKTFKALDDKFSKAKMTILKALNGKYLKATMTSHKELNDKYSKATMTNLKALHDKHLKATMTSLQAHLTSTQKLQ